jgi:hypothetical protein
MKKVRHPSHVHQSPFGALDPRGKLELRSVSQAPNKEFPANLMFRLRALFGVNARTNTPACLLTHPEGHSPDMERQTGYFPKTVQMILAEMAYSGKVYAARKGREKHCRHDRRLAPGATLGAGCGIGRLASG